MTRLAAQRITEQPHKECDVAKRFTWAQWDMTTQTLTYVYLKSGAKDASQRIEYMLRSVTFVEEGRQEPVLDVSLPIRFGRNPAEESEYMHLPCSRPIPGTPWRAAP